MIFYQLDRSNFAEFKRTGFSEFRRDRERSGGWKGPAPTCPQCATRIGALKWIPPYVVRLTRTKFGDFCSDGTSVLLSERFRSAWLASNLKGIEFATSSVQIIGHCEDKTPPYYLANFAHTLTVLDEEASGLIVERKVGCATCRVTARASLERLRLDERSWDGEAAFLPSGLFGVILVSQEFVNFVAEHSLENFLFVHQDDYRE